MSSHCRLEVKYLNERYDLGIEGEPQVRYAGGFHHLSLRGIPGAGETVSIGDLQFADSAHDRVRGSSWLG